MKQIKNDYSILMYILLGLVTLGIYPLWLLHRMANDVNVLCRDTGRQTPGIVPLILLSLVTCGAYSVFWWYRIADILARQVKKRNLNSEISGGFVMIAFVLGYFMASIATWVGIHKVFEAVNELADDYNANILPTLTAQQTQE